MCDLSLKRYRRWEESIVNEIFLWFVEVVRQDRKVTWQLLDITPESPKPTYDPFSKLQLLQCFPSFPPLLSHCPHTTWACSLHACHTSHIYLLKISGHITKGHATCPWAMQRWSICNPFCSTHLWQGKMAAKGQIGFVALKLLSASLCRPH